MSTLRQLRAAVIGMFREGPELLSQWLQRLTDDLNDFAGRKR